MVFLHDVKFMLFINTSFNIYSGHTLIISTLFLNKREIVSDRSSINIKERTSEWFPAHNHRTLCMHTNSAF